MLLVFARTVTLVDIVHCKWLVFVRAAVYMELLTIVSAISTPVIEELGLTSSHRHKGLHTNWCQMLVSNSQNSLKPFFLSSVQLVWTLLVLTSFISHGTVVAIHVYFTLSLWG